MTWSKIKGTAVSKMPLSSVPSLSKMPLSSVPSLEQKPFYIDSKFGEDYKTF